MRYLLTQLFAQFCLLLSCVSFALGAQAVEKPSLNYKLAPGDTIRIVVFQNADLTLDARVSESGSITYPLIGSVQLGGLSLDAAEKQIARALNDGGFVQKPQVNIILTQVRGNQVSVLGQVNRPGRYPLETLNTRLSDVLAMAGGIAVTGADTVIVSGQRDGKTFHQEIDFPAIFTQGDTKLDLVLAAGDLVYVNRAPVFYIYGEVQRPGAYRVERGMTLQQALAQGGGATQRGSESRLRLHRLGADKKISVLSPDLHDLIQADDVIYVRESIL